MSKYATNQSGVIKAPKPLTNEPKSSSVTGDDLRTTKKNK